MDFKYEPGRILLPVWCRMQHKEMDGIIAGQQCGTKCGTRKKYDKKLDKTRYQCIIQNANELQMCAACRWDNALESAMTAPGRNDFMLDVLLDTVLDSVRLLPFLFLTYLFMEALEHHTGSKLSRKIQSAGKWGPVWGGLLGVIPQCGFSAAASSLFAGRVITVGTLVAIYLSASDEMLPILISESVPVVTIVKILGSKVIIAVLSGLIVELVYVRLLKKQEKEMDIHVVCEEEHCHCEDGIVVSALKHTVKIFCFIFLISLVLNGVIGLIGEEALAGLFSGLPVVGELIAALVGLIPNCASSVVITQLYLDGIIRPGAMMAGLLVNAGVGFLVLFRLNRDYKQNAAIIATMYALGEFWGVVVEACGIVF